MTSKKLSFLTVLSIIAVVMTISSMSFSQQAFANRKYAAIVMEANTGRVLFSRYADKKLHPASLTKIMTLLLAFEALERGELSLRDKIYISRRAASMVPSKIGLPRGSTIRVEDAIYTLVTKSANDVAVALAEHLAGTEWRFSRLMTEKAQLIGMRNTHFQNASGLYHPYQRSTARDMAVLSRFFILNYPQYYRYFSTSSFRYRGKTYHNHNRLMKYYDGMDGLKTGYINAAGFNLAASAVRGNNRLIGVVFGGRSTRSRNNHMARILDSSFAKLNTIRMANAEIPKPPEKPDFRNGVLVASADSASGTPLPAPKPDDLEMSSFKLANIDKSARQSQGAEKYSSSAFDENNGGNIPDAESVPPEHFEMLAKVLGSEGFNKVIGQGDYDPTVFSRIETGLMAVSAHSGKDKFDMSENPETLNNDIFSMGRRVFGKLFQSNSEEDVSLRLTERMIDGAPVPPMMPENRLWDEARQQSWSVQIGAFNDRGRTNTILDEALGSLRTDITSAKALVIPLRSGNRIIYRARLTRLDREKAFDICQQLKDCMPIAP